MPSATWMRAASARNQATPLVTVGEQAARYKLVSQYRDSEQEW